MIRLIIILGIVLSLLITVNCEKPRDDHLFVEGEELFNQGQYDEAIAKYEKGLKANPNSSRGYHLLGKAYRFKYNYTNEEKYRIKEIESFKKAIELDTNNLDALIDLGATYHWSGEHKKGAEYFKRALKINPNHPERAELEQIIQEAEQDTLE